MSRLILLSILIAGLAILLPAILSFGIRVIPGQVQPSMGMTERIYSTSVVTEVFSANRNNLSGIGVSLKNPNLQNKQDVVVSLFNDNSELLGQSTVNGASIPDGGFIKFIFEPIRNSEGKNFVFVLSSIWSHQSDATEVFYTNEPVKNPQKLLNGKAPCLSKTSDLKIIMVDLKVDQNCTLLLVENSQKANVSYVTFYKASPLLIIQEVYSGWWNRLYADKSFFVTYLLIIATLVGGLVLAARSKSN